MRVNCDTEEDAEASSVCGYTMRRRRDSDRRRRRVCAGTL